MTRRIGLIGVPSSAGAHWPGQEKAPAAFRAAGLVAELRVAGFDVVDHGDLPRNRMRPDRRHPQNLATVVGTVQAVAERVEAALRADQLPLVLGGDCTIELGVIAGFLRADEDPALLYLDGGVDLRTPAENPTGILDSMGVAHLIGLPGTAEVLARSGPRYPLLAEDRIVLFGFEPNPGAGEEAIRVHRGLASYAAAEVRRDPRQVAIVARRDIEGRASRFALHFDVDVIDFTDFPVADVPQHHAGLTRAQAVECLSVFAASPGFAALTITEFNPAHADEEGAMTATFVRDAVGALHSTLP